MAMAWNGHVTAHALQPVHRAGSCSTCRRSGATSARAAFVIDKDGVVQYAEQTPTPKDLPNFDAIKAKLAELK